MAIARQPKNREEVKQVAQEWVDLCEQVKEFNEEVAALAKKRGIDKIKQDIPILNQRVLNFMQKEGMSRLDLDEMGYVNFIQATGEHVWIGSKADIPKDAPSNAKSLRAILGKDLFLRVTKRVVDPKRLQELVDEGEITEEKIAPAHFTRKRAPYIRHVPERGS